MPRIHDLQPAFNAGEFSPRLAARLDFIKYPAGCETMENFIALPEGGAMRRPGSRYVAEVADSTVKHRLKRFQFSVIQAYMLELGAQKMRFYRHQGQITVADTDAAITNGTFSSNITGWDDVSTGTGSIAHDATNGDLNLVPGGTTGVAIAEQDVTTTNTGTEHVIKFRVVGDPGDKIEFQVGTASGGAQTLAVIEREVGYHCVAFTPTTSPFYVQFRNLGANANKTVSIDDVSLIDNAPVEIDTPWLAAQLFTVEGPQSADVLYLFHAEHPTHKLLRFGNSTWSLAEVAWEDGPYLDTNSTATTLTPGATSGVAVTVTASAVAGINGGDGFKTTDIGRLLRLKNGAAWGWGVIVGHTSTTVVTVHVKKAFAATTANATWRLGAWSETTGYAQVAGFFEQRLYAAATTDQPQTFWGSQTADFESFKPDDDTGTVEADDAFAFTLSADDVNAIRWLSAGEDTIAIGTAGGEWIPDSEGAAITPLDITVRRQTTRGSAQIQPVRVGASVLFVQRAKRRVRELVFSFEADGFQSPDMTRLAHHITRSGIVEMAYQQEPDSVVWAVRDDGVLLSMTFRRDEDVVGWGRHYFGGVFNTAFAKVWQVDVSTNTAVDQTADANDVGNADWTLFPANEAVDDYAAFGFATAFDQLAFDYANGTAGAGGAVAWEYWNGIEWIALADVVDNTTGFTAAAADGLTVTWTRPGDWTARSLHSTKRLYYVRARITTVYTTNPFLDQGFIGGPPVIESVDVIPGANGAGQTQDSSARDELWVSVKRTINKTTKRYVEVLERDYEDGHEQEDAYYCDSLITYDGAAATAITGLGHLEGERVKVWGDGAVRPVETVASSQITLDSSALVAQIGLGYRHRLKTLKVRNGNPAGTPLGKTKRIYGLTFDLLNSHTLSFGPIPSDLTAIDFRAVSDPMDAAAPLFTGERTVEFPGGWAGDVRIVVESDDPAPFTLLALAPTINLNPQT